MKPTPKDKRPLTAGGLDFKSQYPSFESKQSAGIVRKRLEKKTVAKIEVDEVKKERFLTQCSSLKFGGRWRSPNLKFSKLKEIKQYKTVFHHITTT